MAGSAVSETPGLNEVGSAVAPVKVWRVVQSIRLVELLMRYVISLAAGLRRNWKSQAAGAVTTNFGNPVSAWEELRG